MQPGERVEHRAGFVESERLGRDPEAGAVRREVLEHQHEARRGCIERDVVAPRSPHRDLVSEIPVETDLALDHPETVQQYPVGEPR